jgi:transposase-like protein
MQRISWRSAEKLSRKGARYAAESSTSKELRQSPPPRRKAVRSHGHFPSDKAASKLMYLVLQNIEANGHDHPAAGIRLRRNLRYTSKSDSW